VPNPDSLHLEKLCADNVVLWRRKLLEEDIQKISERVERLALINIGRVTNRVPQIRANDLVGECHEDQDANLTIVKSVCRLFRGFEVL
jgi:hypothetical protein